jgi:ferric-dicitrate binding protein FerR (iron transport regulator)
VPQIRIEGEALRTRQFSGVFDADDPQSLVDYLNRVAELSVERSADAIVIRDRR